MNAWGPSLLFAGRASRLRAPTFDQFRDRAARLVGSHHQQERKDPFEKPVGKIQKMMLFGDSPKENGHYDHQPVQPIETAKPEQPTGHRILVLLACFWIDHCLYPLWFLAPCATGSCPLPRVTVHQVVRDRYSCPPPSAAPSSPPPAGRSGCTPYAGRA